MEALPSAMRAIVCAAPGPISVLKMQEIPVPVPQPGQILLKILSFGINRAEMYTRQGHSPITFPRIIGIECVGTIAAYPPSASASPPLPVGTRVATCMGGLGRQIPGSYAEYVCVAQENVRALPPTQNLTAAQLGALPEMLQTTWGGLTAGLGVRYGDSVLVRGATSSIGLCALQLLRRLGASRIAGTTRKVERAEVLRAAGADEVFLDDGGTIAAQVAGSGGGRFDRVLELVGTTTLRDSMRCLRTGGICCMVGIQGGQWAMDGFEPMADLPDRTKLCAYGGGPDDFRAMPWEELVREADEGTIQIPVSVFKFEEAEVQKIHELMESGGGGAKMVVSVAEE
ncbi:Zinc-binding dehydrogenase [Pleurostoma richardsiae]|uniref:Zinc-binding dehydrogenase n=1 Tax=Pleurostoma richardsiae TaxID=41990 RepID=A0AA38R5K5_9PEZI|nr:Zinc-binding dehydrogenase [Pleurostoma richardsiae]